MTDSGHLAAKNYYFPKKFNERKPVFNLQFALVLLAAIFVFWKGNTLFF
jgi:hypothetical protein